MLENDAMEAVEKVDNHIVEGRRISVEMAKDRGHHHAAAEDGDDADGDGSSGAARGGKGAKVSAAATATAVLQNTFAQAARSVLLWGVGADLTAKRLKHRVRKCGDVKQLVMPYSGDVQAVQPGSVALAVFESKEVATKVAASLHNHIVHGCTLLARRCVSSVHCNGLVVVCMLVSWCDAAPLVVTVVITVVVTVVITVVVTVVVVCMLCSKDLVPPAAVAKRSCRLIVRNLPFSTKVSDLVAAFGALGPLREVTMPTVEQEDTGDADKKKDAKKKKVRAQL